MEIQKYVRLKTVVSYFMDQHQKSDGDEDMYWIIALRGLVDNHFDLSGDPKTVMIPINSGTLTCPLPTDCMQWSKVGLRSQNGKISTLKVNPALMTLQDMSPNRLAALAPQVDQMQSGISAIPYFLNYYNNGLYYNLYGTGGGLVQYGECKIDEKRRIILFPPNMQFNQFDQVVLEYISSPMKDGDYMIEIELQEAIIAFLEWKTKLGSERDYHNRQTEGRRRLPGMRVEMDQINQVIRETGGMYLKA